MLFAPNVLKWAGANWKLVAIAAILATSFASGWYIRGYIAEAAQNKAIAAAVAETKLEEGKLYAKAIEQEKRKRTIRERSRVANMAINAAGGDACSDSPVLPEWVRVINDAISGAAGKP